MYLGSITTMAWLVKPGIGYLIDNFLNKKAWIVIALIFDILLTLAIGILSLPLVLLITFMVLNSTNAAFRDVAVDGIMCVEGKRHQATGRIQSVQWIAISVSQLFVGVGGGYIALRWGYKAGFLFLIPVYVIVGITTLFYKEDRSIVSPKTKFFTDLKKLFSDKNLLIVGLFIFLYKYSPSFGTPLFFIQRDVFKWDKLWIGWLGTISTVFAIVGSLLYYKFSTRINIKKWLFASVFLGAITTLSYLYYNPVTAVIYDTVYSFLGMFIFIMVMDFMARESVKGLEATSFAFLCSISNLALVASNLSGAYLLPIVGLKWLVIISALTSFFCLPLIKRIN